MLLNKSAYSKIISNTFSEKQKYDNVLFSTVQNNNTTTEYRLTKTFPKFNTFGRKKHESKIITIANLIINNLVNLQRVTKNTNISNIIQMSFYNFTIIYAKLEYSSLFPNIPTQHYLFSLYIQVI